MLPKDETPRPRCIVGAMAHVHQFDFSFDVAFLKNAMRRDFLWRGYVIGGLLLVLGIVMRFVNGHWELYMTGVCLGGAPMIVMVFHRLLTRIAMRLHALWSLQSPSGVIRYELDEDGFSVVFDTSRSSFKWNGLRRLWCYHDVWLIEILEMQSVFIPPAQVPQESLEYIVERCRAAGVRV